jgi:hypothetical protein
MVRVPLSGLLLVLLAISSAGCTCVQGIAPSGNCGIGACSSGSCGSPFMGFASCKGACGEVYVDEWISEPPTVDNCGYDCGGCGNCVQCRPIGSVLRLLWGRPFVTSCSTGLCGPTCDGGCSSCDGGSMQDEIYASGLKPVVTHSSSGCNCGEQHMSTTHSSSQLMPIPQPPQSGTPSVPMEIAPPASPAQTMPTPAPAMPSSAKRLNPAQNRNLRQASATR